MKKLKLILNIFLMMSLTLVCQKISGTELDLKCLSRVQKEKIESCFEQNFLCHQTLEEVAESHMSDWKLDVLILAGGILSGMVLDYQLNRR